MLSERLQVLVSPDQRRRLEVEAARLRTSVASVVREAVDARLGAVTRADRLRALEEIRALRGRFVAPDELDRISEREREAELPARLQPKRR